MYQNVNGLFFHSSFVKLLNLKKIGPSYVKNQEEEAEKYIQAMENFSTVMYSVWNLFWVQIKRNSNFDMMWKIPLIDAKHCMYCGFLNKQ